MEQKTSPPSEEFRALEIRVADIEAVMTRIVERNERVEADKAWETSSFRMYSVALITYVITAGVFFALGIGDALLSAVIPMLGFVLSTLTLPLLKEWWLRKLGE